MAQKQQKQPQDPYAQEGKRLASTVQRLRGWVGSDPSRNAELGDALVSLTAHRLLGHAYADAAPEAQEAVVLSGRLLAEQGPIGPYTPVSDAVRYFTAAVHLAAIQAGVGMHTAAGRTLQATSDWQEQLRKHLDVVPQLQPSTAVWVLTVQSRAALDGGDVETANSCADAALDRLVEGGLGSAADSYLPMDVHRLVADTRWAAGVVDRALIHDELARGEFDRVVAGRLDNPARLSPALLARLVEPLFPLQRVVADRLIGAGEADRGLVVRRALIETLRGLAKRVGETALAQLARSLDDLAADLRLVGRADEAALASDEAQEVARGLAGDLGEAVRTEVGTSAERADRRPGRSQSLGGWPSLDAVRSFAASTAGLAEARSAAEAEAELLRRAQERAEAERLEAHRLEEERQAAAQHELARRDQERLEAERLAAERAEAERLVAERAAAERAEAERLEAERAAAEEEAARLETKRRREERMEAHRLEEERLEAERREAEQWAAEEALSAEEAERLELERIAAELEELERAERAERAEAERRGVEEAARQEAERAEAERAEAERAEAERAEAERAEAERAEAERAEAERLATEAAERERAAREQLEQEAREREREQRAAEDAARVEAERAEAERLEAEAAEREREARERREQEEREQRERAEREQEERAAEEAARLEAERVAADRAEQDRLETEPEQRVAEQFEPESVGSESVESLPTQPESIEAQHGVPAQDEAAAEPEVPMPAESEPEAPMPAEPEAPAQTEPDELELAIREWQAAKAAGERRRSRAANEQVVALLRPKAEGDLGTYGPQLVDALEQLSSIRLRTGDIFGSRAPSREAKALAKTLDL